MIMRRSALVLVAALIAGTAAESCKPGLYMVVARGTNEPQGTGLMGAMADGVAQRVPESEVVPLRYPATLSDPVYQESVADGVREMQATIRDYVKTCPQSKLAIFGYSQGAQVAMDALCGSSGIPSFSNSTPIGDELFKKNILAVVLFGDPSHVVNATYNRGSSVRNGIFNRTSSSVDVCDTFSDRIVSYCDEGDSYCDRGNDRAVHGLYASRYGAEAQQFVVDRYGDGATGGRKGDGKKHVSLATWITASTTATPTVSATAATDTARASSSASGASQARGSTSSSSSSSSSSLATSGVSVYLSALFLVVLARMQGL